MSIEQSKEAAKAMHTSTYRAILLTIYTDSLGIDNKIGAATYTTSHTLYQHFEIDIQHNVYVRELIAIGLTISIACRQQAKECNIYMNSQAAVKALTNSRRQSGQEIIKATLDNIDYATLELKMKLSVHWIPGYLQIKGNNEANKEAKKAARDPTLSKNFSHSPMKLAWKMAIKCLTKTQQQTLTTMATTAK